MKYETEDGEILLGKMIAHALIVIVALLLLFSSFQIVGAGERGVVLTMGQVSDTVKGEGLHFKIPFLQKIKTLDVKTQVENVSATAASKDLQNVTTIVALNYHLEADKVNKLWQSIGRDYKIRIIDPAIQEAVKAVTSKYTAEELITKRPQVKEDARLALSERLSKEFITVDEFSIVNFDFSPSFNAAIEAKVSAEQNALASKNKLEQVKYEAEQRIVTAKGEAEAIRIQAEAITSQGGAEYVNLKAVEKWNGTLPTYMMSGATPFINLK